MHANCLAGYVEVSELTSSVAKAAGEKLFAVAMSLSCGDVVDASSKLLCLMVASRHGRSQLGKLAREVAVDATKAPGAVAGDHQLRPVMQTQPVRLQ